MDGKKETAEKAFARIIALCATARREGVRWTPLLTNMAFGGPIEDLRDLLEFGRECALAHPDEVQPYTQELLAINDFEKYALSGTFKVVRWPVILAAAHSEDANTFRLLAEAGADIEGSFAHSKEDYNLHGMSYTMHRDDMETAKLLLEHRVNVETTKGVDLGRITPLMAAVRYGHARLVSLALEKGADLFARDNEGKNVIHHALSQGPPRSCTKYYYTAERRDSLVYLLSRGAEVDEEDKPKLKERYPDLFERYVRPAAGFCSPKV